MNQRSLKPFNQDMAAKLEEMTHSENLSVDEACINKIAQFILSNFSFNDAQAIVAVLTKKHFNLGNIAQVDRSQFETDELPKKYLLFYVAHELMFKSLEVEQQDNWDKFAYIKAIGDNLTQWTACLSLHYGESNHIRL